MSWRYVLDMYSTMDIAYAIMMMRKTWYRFFVLGDDLETYQTDWNEWEKRIKCPTCTETVTVS